MRLIRPSSVAAMAAAWTVGFSKARTLEQQSGPIQDDSSAATLGPELLTGLLRVGDFETFNEEIKDLKLLVDDPDPIVQNVLFELQVQLTNVYCTNIQIGDMSGDYSNTNQALTYKLSVDPFGLDCYAEYSYNYGGFLQDSGTAVLIMTANAVELSLGFSSASEFELAPPTGSNVTGCTPRVTIDDVQLGGEVEALVASLFSEMASETIGQVVSDTLCETFGYLINMMDDVVTGINEQIDVYLQPIGEERADPLHPERNFTAPSDVDVLNLINGGGLVGDLFREILEEADDLLNRLVDDPSNPTKQDLAINVLLRDSFLNPDGTFTLSSDPSVIFETADKLIESKVSLSSIKAKGLDSLRVFKPLEELGNYTIANQLAWEALSIETEILFDIGVSTLPDSELISEVPLRTVETVTISFDLQNLDLAAAFFLAIDKAKMDDFKLGNLLRLDTIFSCFGDMVTDMEVSGLDVSIRDIGDPRFGGFSSPGFDRIVSSLVEAALVMYRPTFLRAIPAAFQGDFRDELNKVIAEDDSECAVPTPSAEFIDFRDLLLPKGQAREYGASGEGQYGDLLPVLWAFLKDQFSRVDERSGKPTINRWLIDPLTEPNGDILYTGDIFSIDQRLDIIGFGIKVRLYDAFIQNLDSIGEPMSLLDPVPDRTHVLNNTVTFGIGEPLNLGTKFELVLAGTCKSMDLHFRKWAMFVLTACSCSI